MDWTRSILSGIWTGINRVGFVDGDSASSPFLWISRRNTLHPLRLRYPFVSVARYTSSAHEREIRQLYANEFSRTRRRGDERLVKEGRSRAIDPLPSYINFPRFSRQSREVLPACSQRRSLRRLYRSRERKVSRYSHKSFSLS